VIAGTGITADYSSFAIPGARVELPDRTAIIIPPYTRRSDSRSAIGGPTLAWQFGDRLSLETNAIYRRLRVEGVGPTNHMAVPRAGKVPVCRSRGRKTFS